MNQEYQGAGNSDFPSFVNKEINLSCQMMEWVWAGWWCSLVHRQQLLVEVELVSLVLIHSQGQLWRPWCAQTCACLPRVEVLCHRGYCHLSEHFTPCPQPIEHLMRQRYFLGRKDCSHTSSQQTPALLAFSVAVGERSPALGANKRVRKWCNVWEGGCVELALGNKETTLL